jgi:hypothetical protein
MKNILHVLCFVTLFGCNIFAEPLKDVSLGQIDLTKSNSMLKQTFVCSGNLPFNLTLIIPDNEGETRDYCYKPPWPLVLTGRIIKTGNGNTLLNKRFSNKDMAFTNWNLPDTSILLKSEQRPLRLKKKKEYQMVFIVESPVKDLGKGTIYINWIRE